MFFDSEPFQYLAIATIVVFICIAWRVTLRKFATGFAIDTRNDMDMSRSRWRSRWRSKG